MPSADRQAAVQSITGELGAVLQSCAVSADLKRAIKKNPSQIEAVSFAQDLQSEVDQLTAQFRPLHHLSTDPPRAGAMLSAAFADLRALTARLDTFEHTLDAEYGLRPVVIPSPPPKDPGTDVVDTTPATLATQVADLSSLAGGVPNVLTSSVRATRARTLRAAREQQPRSELDIPMPKTPRLEDFGITNDDLRTLGMPTLEDANASPSSRVRSIGGDGGIPIGSPAYETFGTGAVGIGYGGVRDLDELASKSMAELGIETPAEVADKFEARQLRLVQRVMKTTTPRMKGVGAGTDVADYMGLAEGYYERAATRAERSVDDAPRQLNFDETPRVGGGGGEVARRIAEGYDGLGVWKGKVDCAVLQRAAQVLGGGGFDRKEAGDVLGREMAGQNVNAIFAALSKLEVLEVDKGYGQKAMYRIRRGEL